MNLNLFFQNTTLTGKMLAVLVSILILTGCGGSGGGSSTPVADFMVTLEGGIVKGKVSGASISVFAVDSSGVKTGSAIATATTDADGMYTIALGNFSGVYIVEATGGSYVDEATGQTKSIPTDSPLRAVSSVDTPSQDLIITATVTPLTDIAVQVAEQKTGGLTATNVTASNDEVGALFFGDTASAGDKLLTTIPADVTSESSAIQTDDEKLYGLMLGAITVLQTELGTLSDVTAAIAKDIAADGNLSDVSGDLITASETFINGTTNNSGVTTSTVVTNVLTAAATGTGTTVANSNETDITAFVLTDLLISSIDFVAHSVDVVMPFGTDLATLASPSIATSLGSNIAVQGTEDFTASVIYLVTAEDGTTTQEWTVTVTVAASDLSPLAEITGATSSLIVDVVINRSLNSVVGSVTNLVDLDTLDGTADPKLIFSVSTGASLVQASGSYATGDVVYTLTAEDGSTQQWNVLLRVNDPQPQPAFSITNGNQSLLITDASVQLSTTGGLNGILVTYSSSNPSVVTVDALTGIVLVQGAGTATITASKPGVTTSLVVYLPVEATISVTVSKATQTLLAFAQSSVFVALDGSVSNALAGGSGTGAVNYLSSDTGVATVANDGTVTLVAVGTTTISAVKAGDATYLDSNTASYTLTVSDIVPANCVVDQSNWDECNWQ